MQIDAGLILTIASGAASLAASSSFITWFISKEFSKNREVFWKAIADTEQRIIEKLEYHEKHDDERFEQRDKRIWAMEMWKASVTRQIPVEYPGL